MYLAQEPVLPPFGLVEILLIIVVLVLVVGIVLAIIYFLRKRNKPAQISGNIISTIPRPPEQYIKRCPACKSTYTDETLNFCLSDGTTLETFNDAEYETIIRKG